MLAYNRCTPPSPRTCPEPDCWASVRGLPVDGLLDDAPLDDTLGVVGSARIDPRLSPEISFWWFSHTTQLLPADSFVVDDHLDGIGEHQNLGGRTVAFVVLLCVVSLLLSLRQGQNLSAESASSNYPLLAANVDSAG